MHVLKQTSIEEGADIDGASVIMEEDNKGRMEMSADSPTYDGDDHKAGVDMTGERKHSVVVQEGAELYGDIQTVESKNSQQKTRDSPADFDSRVRLRLARLEITTHPIHCLGRHDWNWIVLRYWERLRYLGPSLCAAGLYLHWCCHLWDDELSWRDGNMAAPTRCRSAILCSLRR